MKKHKKAQLVRNIKLQLKHGKNTPAETRHMLLQIEKLSN